VSIEIRLLKQVRINRRIPLISERFQATDVIEVAMRHHNGGRPGMRAESLDSCMFDRAGESRQTHIDQHPFTIPRARMPNENDVHDCKSLIGNIARDLVRGIIVPAINVLVICAVSFSKWNLFHDRKTSPDVLRLALVLERDPKSIPFHNKESPVGWSIALETPPRNMQERSDHNIGKSITRRTQRVFQTHSVCCFIQSNKQ
jgi:hypothetical protein